MECTNLFNDTFKFLHKQLLEIVLDESLSDSKQLQVLLMNLNNHASNLEATILKDVEKIEEKRLGEIINKCTNVYTQLHESIRYFEKSVDHNIELYKKFH